jgi:hypothetical protein
MPHGNFVTLNSWATLSEARHAAQRLKAAGIPSFIRGEAAALVAPDPARAAVSLEVAEDDLEHAQLILADVPPAGAIKPADNAGLAECFPADTISAEGLVTVEVFFDSLEAKTAADLLRARGIECGLRGTKEGILPGMGEIPRLSLEVHERDLERAYQALGYTVENEEEESDLRGSGHIQSAEPLSSRQIERHPFQQREPADLAAESRTPAVEDNQVSQPAPRSLEAGSGGLDFGLILLLFLLAAVAIIVVVFPLF